MAGILTENKIKDVFHKLVFLDGDKLYTTEAGGATDLALPGINLNDDIGVTYGTGIKFKMSYSNGFEALVLNSTTQIDGNVAFLSVKNDVNEVFGVKADGVVSLATVTTADSPSSSGDLKFADNNLYIAKD